MVGSVGKHVELYGEMTSLLYGRNRILLLGCAVCSTLAFIFIIQKWSLPPSHILWHTFFNYSLRDEEPIDPEQTCHIPRIHPFDKSIWKYLTDLGPLKCKSRQPDLTYIDGYGRLRFNSSELQRMGFNPNSVHCVFRPILRYSGKDDNFYFGEEQQMKPEGSTVVDDFIHVKCYKQTIVSLQIPVYEHFHVHARNTSKKVLPSERTINVLIFGVDSLSRLAFIRLLPKTYTYLKRTMNAFVFRGMNKIGDNTFPNLCAVLTGYELYGGVLPHPPKIENYDNWPIIWKNYSDEGHATLLAEDLPEYAIFNYLTTGFYDPPTTHYMRPFWLAVQDSSLLRKSGHLCLGKMPRHMFQITYILDFIKKYSRYFAFSWLAEVTHDYLQRSAVLDDDFENMLRYLHGQKLLENTLLVFMSDHGHRFSSIRETGVGRLEERLPFVAFVVPDKLKRSQPHIMSVLQQNTRRLVSPFDVHATLRDILRYIKEGVGLGKHHFRHGLSLFGDIPANRSCEEAGVPENFCACDQQVELPINDARAKEAAKVLVKHLNDLIRYNGSDNVCAVLRLNLLKSAHLVISSKRDAQNSTDRQTVTVVIEAKPGFGIFEANVVISGEQLYVIGDVSRINMYRGQSECIQDRELRKYCFCVK